MELTLSFNGTTKTLTPIDVEGCTMYDLNEIWREWNLSVTERPAQWRSKDRAEFSRTADLQSRRNGQREQTLATQLAVYAYAMWAFYWHKLQ